MKIPYLNRHLYVLWLKKPLSEKRLRAIRKGLAWIKEKKVTPDLSKNTKNSS